MIMTEHQQGGKKVQQTEVLTERCQVRMNTFTNASKAIGQLLLNLYEPHPVEKKQ